MKFGSKSSHFNQITNQNKHTIHFYPTCYATIIPSYSSTERCVFPPQPIWSIRLPTTAHCIKEVNSYNYVNMDQIDSQLLTILASLGRPGNFIFCSNSYNNKLHCSFFFRLPEFAQILDVQYQPVYLKGTMHVTRILLFVLYSARLPIDLLQQSRSNNILNQKPNKNQTINLKLQKTNKYVCYQTLEEDAEAACCFLCIYLLLLIIGKYLYLFFYINLYI